jgi:plastocyanin
MNTKIAVAVGLAAMLAAIFIILHQQAVFAAGVKVDIVGRASSQTNTEYAPKLVRANVGDSVIWTNKDSDSHTVTSNDPAFDSGILEQNATFRFPFNKEGISNYYCTLHPNMLGTVSVSAGTGGNGGGGGSITTIGLIVGGGAAAVAGGVLLVLRRRAKGGDQSIP